MDAASFNKVTTAASEWVQARDTELRSLSPDQKKELIADVAQSTSVSGIEVTQALVGLWAAVNESRGLGVTKHIGEWQNQGVGVHTPLFRANGMAALGAHIANQSLGKVHSWNAPNADTPAKQKSEEAFRMDKAGNHAGAILLYQEAMALDPGDARIRTRLGLALKHAGQMEEAKKSLAIALALDPAFPPAHYNAACLAAMEGDADKAALHLAQALFADRDAFSGMAMGDKDFAKVGGGNAIIAKALASMQ